MHTELPTLKSFYKYRKIILGISVCISLLSAAAFLVLNLMTLKNFPLSENSLSIPFFGETYRQLSNLNNYNYYINIFNVLITVIALLFMLRGKKRGLALYIFSRIVLLLNITLLSINIKDSLSVYIQISLAFLLSLWMVLLYSYLIKQKKSIAPVLEESETESSQQ